MRHPGIAYFRESRATCIAINATLAIGFAVPDTITTPADRFISRFGVATLARWTRRNRSRVHAWAWPRGRGGTGGAIPHAVRAAIISGAKSELNEDVAYAEFEPMAGEGYHLEAAEDLQ